MEILQSVVAFIVAIGLLVTVHEFGHFWVARRLGVKVLKFSVGFGRPLLVKRGGPDQTEYVLAAIPLGGYVKMLDEREGNVTPDELDRAFNRQPLSVRIAVVVAGPIANFLFAIFAYWLTFVIGVSGLRAIVGEVTPGSLAEQAGLTSGLTIGAVDQRAVKTWEGVVQAVIAETVDAPGPIRLQVSDAAGRISSRTLDMSHLVLDDLTEGQFFNAVGLEPSRPSIPPIIGSLSAGERAAAAGLRSGDEVLKANGESIEHWGAWVAFVRARPEQPIDLVVLRDGREHRLQLVPAAVDTEVGPIGRIGAAAYRVDAVIDRYYVTERYSAWRAFTRAVGKTYDISALTLGVFWKMLQLEVSLKNLSGPISIAQYAGYSAEIGLTRFLEFLAIVSISLGILNLLPIPVLDGGHLLFYLVELVKGGPLSEQSQLVGQQLGIALLVGLMSLAFYNDLARLFG